jgi:8-oxo-dGTP pyrophosphatase MutT (NUDIX family)
MNCKTIQKSGAIILSALDKNRIALLYRGKQKDWSFPKGHVEIGENQIQAMVREVKEETGLDVRVLKELPDLDYVNSGGDIVATKIFLVQSNDDSLLKLEHPADGINWTPIDDVIDLLSYKNLKDYFKKIKTIIKEAILTF